MIEAGRFFRCKEVDCADDEEAVAKALQAASLCSDALQFGPFTSSNAQHSLRGMVPALNSGQQFECDKPSLKPSGLASLL